MNENFSERKTDLGDKLRDLKENRGKITKGQENSESKNINTDHHR